MGKSVLEFGNYDGFTLRAENENSIFLPEWFDDAIIGIDNQTKSIMYSLDEAIQLEINLRFEEGGLNPEYDDVDDDILIVGHDCILKLFRMLQVEKEGVPPTLYDESNASVYDLNVASNISSTMEGVFGNEVCRDAKNMDMPSKEFTYDQLGEIVITNEAEYLRWLELQAFNPSSSFELIPRELISFDDDEEDYVRTVVKLVNEPYWLGFQDITLDQWELGRVCSNHDAA